MQTLHNSLYIYLHFPLSQILLITDNWVNYYAFQFFFFSGTKQQNQHLKLESWVQSNSTNLGGILSWNGGRDRLQEPFQIARRPLGRFVRPGPVLRFTARQRLFANGMGMAGRDVTLGSTELLALPVQVLVGPTRFRRIVKPVLPAGPPELQAGTQHVQQPIRNRHVRQR